MKATLNPAGAWRAWGLDFRSREVAERADNLAEAATLYHAERRLTDDPLAPDEGCIKWKAINDLPYTPRERAWLDERLIGPCNCRECRVQGQ